MAGRRAVFQDRRSIVGAVFIGVGLLIVIRNLAESARLIRFFRILGDQTDALGPLAAASTAARHFLQGYFFNHAEFLRVLYEVLLSFSGMLLIVTGTVFLRLCSRREEKARKRKRACRFCCLSFDA
jgi:hypothetical protein